MESSERCPPVATSSGICFKMESKTRSFMFCTPPVSEITRSAEEELASSDLDEALSCTFSCEGHLQW
ncbi:hypothetical protein QYF36_027145 [Acer negundo]|nr:hypothetical protein QYF36_027145 [Acer negundo]